MIQVPNELRNVTLGATVNLFVSVGQTSRRLKGEIRTVYEHGASDEIKEIRIEEDTPSGSEIVLWIGGTDEEAYLLPLEADEDGLVYAEYRYSGGKTGLYIDAVREVGVRGLENGTEADADAEPEAESHAKPQAERR